MQLKILLSVSFFLFLNCFNQKEKWGQDKIFLLTLLNLKMQTEYLECSPIPFTHNLSISDLENDAKIAGGTIYSGNQSFRDILNAKVSLDSRWIKMVLGLKEFPEKLPAINNTSFSDRPASEWSFLFRESDGNIFKIGLFRNIESASREWNYNENRIKVLRQGKEIIECEFPVLQNFSLYFQCEIMSFTSNRIKDFSWNAYSYHQENRLEIKDCL